MAGHTPIAWIQRDADTIAQLRIDLDQARLDRDRYLGIIGAASAVLVPKADYERVCQERDSLRVQCMQALDDLDATAGRLQAAQDKRANRLAARLLQLWQDELRDADKEWHPNERRWRHNEVRAILIEQGRDAVGEEP